MIAYIAINRITRAGYVGITKASLNKRKIEHRSSASVGSKNLFHVAMRLRANGESLREIGEKYGCTASAVCFFIKNSKKRMA